jgi:hypothetical protein
VERMIIELPTHQKSRTTKQRLRALHNTKTAEINTSYYVTATDSLS